MTFVVLFIPFNLLDELDNRNDLIYPLYDAEVYQQCNQIR